MNKLVFLLLIMFALAMLAISACGKDDDGITDPFADVTPANTDWNVFFWDAGVFSKPGTTTYSLSVDWLGAESGITESDVISLKIDDVTHPLTGSIWGGDWFFDGQAFLVPGNVYTVVLLKNGNRVAIKDIRMPYPCQATFPDTFDPAQAHTVSWTQSGTNQLQYFSGWSSAGGEWSDYNKVLGSNVTSHTMPANSLQSYGVNTYFAVQISQLSYVRDGRTAFTAESADYKNYSNWENKADLQSMRRILRQKMIASL